MSRTACFLTTIANPFDPYDNFDSWYLYDMDKGYSSCSYLARVARYTDQMSEFEQDRETERAIDEIILYNPTNLYKKIRKVIPDD